jgi:glycosyltransferase involved in cell wall biosynthesis
MVIQLDKNKPIVSVLIPTYNRVVELERAIKSVLNQTVSDFEIIVINDSNEEEPVQNLINRFRDQRIRYCTNKRSKGGSGARNTGLLQARGKYIALLDDDDEWMPKKLEAQLRRMNNLDSTWGGCYCGFVRKVRLKWKVYIGLKEGDIKKDYLLNKVPVCGGSTLLLKRSALDANRFFDEELDRHQDTHFLIVFLRSYKLAFINEPLVKIHSQNYLSGKKYERAKLLLLEKIRQDISELSESEKKTFFALNYADLALSFSHDGHTSKTIFYFLKSISNNISFSKNFLYRYVALVILFINAKTGWILNRFLGLKIKHKSESGP